MRAMPSPTSMTRPTSWRSTSASYPASWRLMISLISPALIAMSSPYVDSPCVERLRLANPYALSLREPLTDARELSVQTSVEHEAADLGNEAAHQARIDFFFEHDLLTAEP